MPEAADSRLVPLDQIDVKEARAHRLRLRLHFASRLLFGDPIFMTEGWSLDSTSFLLIASEILEAIEELSGYALRPSALKTYSPFRIELTRRSTYLSTYCDYLARDDCSWSGIPLLRQDAGIRERLRTQLAQIDDSHIVSASRVGDIFIDGIDDMPVGSAIGLVARYASQHADRRLARRPLGSPSFVDNLLPLLSEAGAWIEACGEADHSRQVRSFLSYVTANAATLTSSSLVVAAVREQTAPDLHAALEHVARLAYMSIHTRGEGASFTAPILNEDAPPVLLGIDAHLALKQRGLANALEFTASDDGAPVLMENLGRISNWRPIWCSIVSLALDPDWQAAVRELRAAAAGQGSEQKIFRDKNFEKLERILAARCPDLVLQQSAAERWNLGFKIHGREVRPGTVGKALDFAVQTALLTIPAWVFAEPIAIEGAQLAAWTAGKKIADRFADKIVSNVVTPLSRKSTRSSLFRLVPFRGEDQAARYQ